MPLLSTCTSIPRAARRLSGGRRPQFFLSLTIGPRAFCCTASPCQLAQRPLARLRAARPPDSPRELNMSSEAWLPALELPPLPLHLASMRADDETSLTPDLTDGADERTVSDSADEPTDAGPLPLPSPALDPLPAVEVPKLVGPAADVVMTLADSRPYACTTCSRRYQNANGLKSVSASVLCSADSSAGTMHRVATRRKSTARSSVRSPAIARSSRTTACGACALFPAPR